MQLTGRRHEGITTAVVVSLVASLVGGVAGSDCAPPPVVSKIRNVTLSNGAVSRGIALSLGTPAQELAFSPRWPISNILVWGRDGHCDKPKYPESACVTWRGGRYDPALSDSRDILEKSSIPFEPNSYTLKALDFLADTVTIDNKTSLSNFALGIPNKDVSDSGHQPLSGLGLGPNSTILEALKESGKIASRTWSMFYGWMGVEDKTQRDGTFVFGGYDRAKVSGRAYPFTMSDDCDSRLVVTISDVTLNFPNGTEESVFDEPMTACIVPHYPVLLSLEQRQVLKMTGMMGVNTTKSMGLLFEGERFESGSKPYAGDLTIKLQSGPTVRIPNHQLVQPERVIDESNGELIINGEERVLAIKNFGKALKTMPSLGKQFLSAVYLMANLDAETFTLWEADATEKDEELVAVDEEGKESSSFCGAASTSKPPQSKPTKSPAPTRSPAPNTTSDTSTDEKKEAGDEEEGGGLSTGAIAGIVVGVVALVIIAAAVAFFLIRRRRRQEERAELPPSLAAEAPPAAMPANYSNRHSELADTLTYKSEMPAHSLSSPSSPFGKSELSGTPPPQMLDSRPPLRHELE